ncbi:MAG: flagellar protein FlgN [Lachnospiraceae bacterium]|nr:flagellar protein FlgN [Lachnospiraceae bacterium]
MKSQLTILSESMDQKIKVLLEIQEYNRKQEEAFKNGEADLDSFDEAVEEKGKLIEKLTRLDDGFEALYEGISKELSENRNQYATEIKELQNKIARVTELGTSIQAQEARNKKLIEEYFRGARAGVRQNRQSSKAAYDYYKSMSGVTLSSSRYMDQKK